MASFKVIGVDISSDGFSRFLEISILREICFLILETAKPAFSVLIYETIIAWKGNDISTSSSLGLLEN